MTLTPLGHLARQPTGIHPDDTWGEYRKVIEDAIGNQPRSLQTRIGPSELGTDCDRCLIHKLAGTPEQRGNVPWLPFVGTAVHEQLQGIFAAANEGQPVRWLCEMTVSVGEVGGLDITGHADLYDLHTGEVTDWKVVGATTLRDAKANGPSQQYRRQAHLYGRGFTRRGLPVTSVRIAYLPRNEPTLANAHIWHEPYDEQVALATLERASALHAGISVLGADTVLQQAPPHSGSHQCSRYPDGPATRLDGHGSTASLLGVA